MTSPVSDAMIEAGVSVIYGMDHNLGKTAENRCDDDVLRNDLAELYLAMKAKEEAADRSTLKEAVEALQAELTHERQLRMELQSQIADQSPADEIERLKVMVLRRTDVEDEQLFAVPMGLLRAALPAIKDQQSTVDECTLGVGDGSGQLFVHGSYEAIKRVQSMVFELEAIRNGDKGMRAPDMSNYVSPRTKKGVRYRKVPNR